MPYLKAVKEFEVREGSTENMWYKIDVLQYGQLIQTFLKPTMKEAWNDFASAGYKRLCSETS